MSAWRRFWFQPQSTTALGLLRIAIGLVVVASTLSLASDFTTWFGPHGPLPFQPNEPHAVDILGTHPSTALIVVVFFVLLISGICLTIGLGTRVAAVVVWLLLMSLQRRNPQIFDAGDNLMRLDAFYLMFAPAGAALSVDRWLRHRDNFWDAPQRAQWALRLIQLQVSAMYLFAVWAKLRSGQDWNNGTAVSFALQTHDLQRFPVPSPFVHNIYIVNLETYATLAVETSLAFLVWNRRLRPWVLLAGIGLHLFIDLGILVGFFSFIVIANYVAFLPPDTADRFVANVRRAVGRGRTPPTDVTPVEPLPASPLVGQVPTQP